MSYPWQYGGDIAMRMFSNIVQACCISLQSWDRFQCSQQWWHDSELSLDVWTCGHVSSFLFRLIFQTHIGSAAYSYLESQLCGFDGSNVSARTGAHHRDIGIDYTRENTPALSCVYNSSCEHRDKARQRSYSAPIHFTQVRRSGLNRNTEPGEISEITSRRLSLMPSPHLLTLTLWKQCCWRTPPRSGGLNIMSIRGQWESRDIIAPGLNYFNYCHAWTTSVFNANSAQ